MSAELADRKEERSAWPHFQRELYRLPDLTGTAEEWEDVHLAAEFVRVYQVSKEKVMEAEPGFKRDQNTETNCFFGVDGTKHVVSRLLSRPQDRINEIRLTQAGHLIRLHYEKTRGPSQNLDDLFQTGLLGLEEDTERFATFPNYVMRFFLLIPEGEFLKSTFRGVCYFNQETGEVVTEEAQSL